MSSDRQRKKRTPVSPLNRYEKLRAAEDEEEKIPEKMELQFRGDARQRRTSMQELGVLLHKNCTKVRTANRAANHSNSDSLMKSAP